MTGLPHPERGADVRFSPPLVFVIATAIGSLMHYKVHRLRFGWGAVPSAIAGLVIGIVALGLMGSAVRLFRRTGQDPEPWKPSPTMIASGPYRYTRNPMYVGMTLLEIALGIGFNELWIALLAPVALAAVHFIAVIPEERYLTSKFREDYQSYLARVRRYI